MAAAQIVQADHKKALCIDGLAGANTFIPPTGSLVFIVVVAGGVMMSTQGVTHQYGVGTLSIQLTVGFVDQLIVGQAATAGQQQWLVKPGYLRRNKAYRLAVSGCIHSYPITNR